MKQKPEKIKQLKSKIIDVPSNTEEILYEHFIQNHSIRRDINKPNIIKDEILLITTQTKEKGVNDNKENIELDQNKDKKTEENQTDNENKDANEKPKEEIEKGKEKEKLVDNKEKPKEKEEEIKEIKNIFDNENIINVIILLSNEEDVDKKKFI